jgi:hypothetical protein
MIKSETANHTTIAAPLTHCTFDRVGNVSWQPVTVTYDHVTPHAVARADCSPCQSVEAGRIQSGADEVHLAQRSEVGA